MNRKEFIKMCGILGVGIPLHLSVASCRAEDDINTPPNKVIIVGAGPAGLSAAYLLNKRGIEVQVLEAADTYGGRIKTNNSFTEFPIPLGAEWLHVEKGVLNEIVNDSSVTVDINTTPYNHEVDYGLFEGSKISVKQVGFTIDQKFIGSSWLDFFNQYIVPSIASKISFNKQVEEIDYSNDQILVKTADEEFSGDKVIVTAPVKLLQNGTINFIPALPNDKAKAIKDVTVWDGCKAFIEFSDKF
ncbi:MAG: FAD-dependent oxidoreductase, partial [Bacteroidota bacterium]